MPGSRSATAGEAIRAGLVRRQSHGVESAELGRIIRRLRKDRELSIDDLARIADIHPSYISGIERGLRNPTWSKVSDIALALRKPLSSLAARRRARSTDHADRCKHRAHIVEGVTLYGKRDRLHSPFFQYDRAVLPRLHIALPMVEVGRSATAQDLLDSHVGGTVV